MLLAEELQKKWKPLLEHKDLAPIKDTHRKAVTAAILENTERSLRETASMGPQFLLRESPVPVNAMGASSSTASAGAIDTFDPVLITLVRRSMPNLIAYDICGVQPMTGPTGLIFAMRSRYANQTHTENRYNEVNTAYSSVVSGANTLGLKHTGTSPGNTTVTANLAEEGLYNYAGGMTRAQAEALGTDSNAAFPEMAFSIEKVMVEAKSRALKAEYTMELAQDLKAIHGLDAETELANILSTEILAEINREIVRTIYVTAKRGSTSDTTTTGIFDLDVDANGRWSVEKFKGLMFHIERECNVIAKETRRGKGNMMICSSDVASALQMAGVLDYTPALDRNNNMTIDDTGNTFVGVLNGRIKVYVDPYASSHYMVVGYKGSSPFDAGLFYCPYVPLQMVRAVDQGSFTPKIGFKTRYGVVANPFSQGATASDGTMVKDSNVYYRRTLITNLM
jgi:Major capsid protein Gp23